MHWLRSLISGLHLLLLPLIVFSQTTEVPAPSNFSEDAIENSDDPNHASIDGDVIRPVSTPSSSSTSSPPASSSRTSLSLAIPSTTHGNRTHAPVHGSSTKSHTASHTVPFTFHHVPPGMVTTAPPRPNPVNTPVAPSHHQSTAAIAIESVVGFIALVVLALLLRCFYKWKRAPRRDRIAALLSRHQLEREMEELEREDLERRMRQVRRSSLYRPPPPPYLQAPSYEEVIDQEVTDHHNDA